MSGVPNGFRMGSDQYTYGDFATYGSLNRDTDRDFALLEKKRSSKAPKIPKLYQALLPSIILILFAEKREPNILISIQILSFQRSF